MRVEIALLGGFAVSVDGVTLSHDQWKRRQAMALVKLLALAPRRRLHRDRVADALWPDSGLEAALPRLHKAAHFARQALCSRDAVVLRDEIVALFPGVELQVDVTAFEAAAEAALRSGTGSAQACQAAIELYRELLPDDLGEPWSEEPRERLRSRFEHLLRGAGRWQDLLRLDPADEQAHVELLRGAVLAGDRAGALRRYTEMERILGDELGVEPSAEAVELRERALAASAAGQPRPAAALRPLSGMDETLLERDEELAALTRTARAMARTGRGCVVTVAGEAGSGKSSLVRAFVDQLGDDLVVAVGGCDDLLAPRSLGPLRDMAATVPGLAAALAGAASPDDVFTALLRFLAAARTVLIVEDVHWADDATLDAIRYLSRRIPGVPALLLLTYREEEVEAAHPLRRILGSLGSASNRRLELPPLSVGAVRRLAGVQEAEAAEIHRVTRGNPFFVTEVLAAGGEGVPATVRDAVLARAGRLPPAARRLTERIAVVPSRAERWLAESLAGGDLEVLLHAERSGVISGGAEYVAFRHELARRAIEASLTVGELVQANREVLDVLLEQPDVDPSRVVHHAARALRTDLLLQHGPVAADNAQRAGAHRQAAETLRVVLEHASRLGAAGHARLLTQRAYSLYVVNDYETALPCAESAVSVAERSGDAVTLAEALMTLSRIVFFARGPMVARQAAARAVQILEKLGDDARVAAALIELARTHSNLATVGIVAQPSAEVVECAQRALALGDRLSRDDLRAQALCYLGSGRLALGDARGAEDIDHAIALGAAEPRLETRVRCYVNAAGSAYRAGQLSQAERYVQAGLQLAADGEFAAGQYRLHLTWAAVHASRGDWESAISALRRLLADPGQPGVMVLLVRSMLARLLARRGDPEAAVVLREAWRDPVWAADSYVAGPLVIAQVELGWLGAEPPTVAPQVWEALRLAADSRHTAIQAELCVYLRRAGHDVTAPADAPGPWAPALAGHHETAARAWKALGDQYEQALELVGCGDGQARAAGMEILAGLGAHAAINRLRGTTIAA